MVTAFTVCGQQISETLGTATEFLLSADGMEKTVVCSEKIPIFLKKFGVKVLVCNGIGNCMMDLLGTMGIEVIPGVTGEIRQVMESYQAGTLTAGEKYSCTDRGESCGACAGTF